MICSMEQGRDDLQFKIVIIGDSAVGKTSLRRTYMGDSFETNYLITMGVDFSAKTIERESQRRWPERGVRPCLAPRSMDGPDGSGLSDLAL